MNPQLTTSPVESRVIPDLALTRVARIEVAVCEAKANDPKRNQSRSVTLIIAAGSTSTSSLT